MLFQCLQYVPCVYRVCVCRGGEHRHLWASLIKECDWAKLLFLRSHFKAGVIEGLFLGLRTCWFIFAKCAYQMSDKTSTLRIQKEQNVKSCVAIRLDLDKGHSRFCWSLTFYIQIILWCRKWRKTSQNKSQFVQQQRHTSQ